MSIEEAIAQYNNLIESGGQADSIDAYNGIMERLDAIKAYIDENGVRYYINEYGYLKTYGNTEPANN